MSTKVSQAPSLKKDFDKILYEMLAVMKMNCALNCLLNREDSDDLIFDSCSREGLALIHNAIADKCSTAIDDLCNLEDTLTRDGGHE